MEWLNNYQLALEKAQELRKPILLQFEMENCGGCKKLYSETYTDEKVAHEMQEWFVLLKLDIIKEREIRKSLGAYWTPAMYFLDQNGRNAYSFNGYLPANEFRALMRVALSEILIPKGKYDDVISLTMNDFDELSTTSFASKLLMQKGLAEYIKTKNKDNFKMLIKGIIEKYPFSSEAKTYFWND
ncbi:MAG TPA: thioredoxin family protein [Ignavibacteriales bacterium]|nr:thioredoxin family protein [Ignavibacteriales bacterium]HOL80195.1 thioredoxin family protein [Ignavibacteriales bacterium]HOM64477.1 thioredoxin family protein [Ignavibacteriales bacterium]HPD68258.1 thioredoxin family protein [Ignavibacteriales bacterium]HPP32384.1 thioredoxin family protein [Ignavibacteriales bacterium]